MTIENVPATTLRNNLSDVLDSMAHKEVMLIRRRSSADVALINIDLLEDLLELRDKKYARSIRDARKQIMDGKSYSFDEVFGGL